MHEETFEHILEWGTVLVALVVLVTPALVHWRLRHDRPVNVGVWRLIGLHQPEDHRLGAPSHPTCRNWHVGWAHGVWWLYFLAMALVWVVLRVSGGIHN